MKTMLFLTLLCFTLKVTYAEELSSSGHTLYVENSAQWELAKDLFGIPFILFSPQVNGQRSNISFAHSGVELELDIGALKDNQKDYQQNKEQWGKTHNAQIMSFTPYHSYLNSLNHRVHSIGVIYQTEGRTYQETSFYTECKGKIVFAKGLALTQNLEHQKYFKELIHSLDCGIL